MTSNLPGTLTAESALEPGFPGVGVINLPLDEAFLVASRQDLQTRATRPSLSYWRDAWIRLQKNKQAIGSLIVIVLLFLFVGVGPLFWHVNSSHQELGRTNEPASLKNRTTVVVDIPPPFAIRLEAAIPSRALHVTAAELAAPSEVKLESAASTERVRLTWTAVPRASGYAVYRANLPPLNANELGLPLGNIGAGNQLNYEDTSDLKPESFYYSIVAKNAEGDLSPLYTTLAVDIRRSILVDDARKMGFDAHVGEVLQLSLRPFGTDSLGRDLLSRMMEGGRISLFFGLFAPLFATLIGAIIGGISGYFGGWVDAWIMRFTDFVLALPFLLFMILFRVASGTQPGESGIGPMLLAIVLLTWTGPARLVRGQVLQLRETEFVQAARLLGARPGYLITRHLLPNTVGVILISLTFAIPSAIFTEAFLSFIGMGVVPPAPSWGQMCDEGIRVFMESPHVFLFPATFISVTVLAFNLLGDGLKDALDPRMRSLE